MSGPPAETRSKPLTASLGAWRCGSEVTTVRHGSASAAGETAASTPKVLARATAADETSKPTTGCPPAINRSQNAEPIAPRPMTPIGFRSLFIYSSCEPDRKSVVLGKSVTVRVDLGGSRRLNKHTSKQNH